MRVEISLLRSVLRDGELRPPLMPPELVVVLAVVVAIAIGVLVWRGRTRALPGDDRPAIEPAAAEKPPEPKGLPAPEPEIAPAPAPVEPEPTPRFAPPPKVETPHTPVPLPVDKPRIVEPKIVDAKADDDARRESERARLRAGLAKTRGGFVAKLARLLRGKPKVDADLKDRIEEVLLTADIGASTADRLLGKVTEVLDRNEVGDADAVWSVIERAALEIVDLPAPPLDFSPPLRPYVLLMIGVNGVGKTTTLGKLASRHAAAGRRVLLVAGDTFRAAAVDQLDVWARRVAAQSAGRCALHRGEDKADPSSVIYEGIARGRREGFDVVLCDTAGRLHTRKELMDELGKVRRAAAKAVAAGAPEERRAEVSGPHDTWLVLDATIGQNALAQAKLFKETTDFTGLVVTKLDGTAKGGVVLGICDEMKIPIRYVGIGEGIEDLREFSATGFVDALLADRDRAAEPVATAADEGTGS